MDKIKTKRNSNSYEPTYKELMRMKLDVEWEKLSPEMCEFAKLANNIAELYRWL